MKKIIHLLPAIIVFAIEEREYFFEGTAPLGNLVTQFTVVEGFQMFGTVPASAKMKLSRDRNGNAIGRLRSPIIEVPVANYNAEDCLFTGTMTPSSPERLAELYPTHQSYIENLLIATDEAVDSRVLLCRGAQTIMRKASDRPLAAKTSLQRCPAAPGSGIHNAWFSRRKNLPAARPPLARLAPPTIRRLA